MSAAAARIRAFTRPFVAPHSNWHRSEVVMDTQRTITIEDDGQIIEPNPYDFTPNLPRRTFVQVLGAGLIIAVAMPALGQEQPPPQGQRRRGGGGGGFGRGDRPVELGARLHLGADGSITVLTGKVEA